MIYKSIRWQIQAWHGLLLVIVVSGLLFAFYHFETRDRLHKIDAQLENTLILAMPNLLPPNPRPPANSQFPPPPPGSRPPETAPPTRGREQNFLNRLAQTTIYYVLFRPDSSVARDSANAPKNIVFVSKHLNPGTNDLRTRDDFRELIQYSPGDAALLIGTNISQTLSDLHALAWKLVLVGAGVVALGMLGGWCLAGRVLSPIRAISAAAETIANGDLSKRIDVHEIENELGQLSAVLNHTFERLQQSFEQQSRFTSDVSHELRTPLTIILSQTQLALSRERSTSEYRESLETCQRTAQRMRELINSMLELASIDSGEYAWSFQNGDLAEVAKDCVATLSPLAKEKAVTLHCDFSPAICQMDAESIGRVITNLLSNAIQHHRSGGEVRLTTEQNAREAILMVSDNGPGIATAHLPHLFERFYRADQSRTRKTGSTGLGLAISKAIVVAHRGEIRVESALQKGSEFRMILPRSQPF